MKKLNVLIAGAVVAASMVAAGASAQAATVNNKCSVEAAKLGQWGNAIQVNGNQVSASFKVVGTNCTTPVTLAVWERPTAEGINDQVLNNYTTRTFGPGVHTLNATLPACMWQVDVVQGANPTAADGTANYQYQNGEFVDGGLRDFMKGGAGVCEDEPEQPEEPETPVRPVAKPVGTTPEALPVTGPGAIFAGAFGASTVAGVAHNIIQRKRRG
jgi:hypothetical protein